MAKFNVEFDLDRDDNLLEDDENFFDMVYIENEIKSWLEDLDYRVRNIRIQEWKEDKHGNLWVHRK